MNHLFEKWRKLAEQEMDPKSKYFGDDPEKVGCILDMRQNIDQGLKMDKDDFAGCMEDSGYRLLGHGSFRSAFSIPGRDDLILKTVNPRLIQGGTAIIEKTKNMNKQEAQGSFQTSSNLVVRVYDSADDFLWIKSEKVIPIKNWRHMLEFFPKLQRTMKNMNFQKIFPSLLRRDPYKELAGIYQDPLLIEIIDVLQQFKAPTWDIRPGNVGYVERGGKKQFVILDPGFGLPSDDLNDAMKRGDVPIPQELRGDEEELVDPFKATKTMVGRPLAQATKVAKPRSKDDATRVMHEQELLEEGAVQDFARKWGVPIALAGSLMSSPGCASNPFSKNCDISSIYRTENPRKATIELMRKYNIKSFLLDGEISMGHFYPSKRMARKFPKLKGGVDVSDARSDMQMQQLIVLKKALGEI